MTSAAATHLRAIGASPRFAGGEGERGARAYATDVLRAAGFDVAERPFEFSALPGIYGLPLVAGPVTAMLLLAIGAMLGGWFDPSLLLGACVGWIPAILPIVRPAGTRTLRWLRRSSVNLEAVRAGTTPRVWLVAHLDSKSQPIPSAARAAALIGLSLALAGTCAAAIAETPDAALRTPLWGLLGLAALSGIPLSCCITGNRSDGAVDNASGAAAVLAAAEQLPSGSAVGILLTSGEELGMAGMREWVAGRAPGAAINCDGVDDVGALTIMHNGAPSARWLDAVRAASDGRVRTVRMPLGVLTDSTVLQRAGWDAATVSHGSLATLRRIHTPADSLARLDGRNLDTTAAVLARAAEALSR